MDTSTGAKLRRGLVVVRPPVGFDDLIRHKHSVFLAGSIEMATAVDWQAEFINSVNDIDLLVLNPRREHWDPTWKQTADNPLFAEQVNWELDALEATDIIVMYFDPNTKSPISLLELGLFAASGKLMVCCPEGFWRKGNVDIVCQRYNVPMFDSLDELIQGFRSKLQGVQ